MVIAATVLTHLQFMVLEIYTKNMVVKLLYHCALVHSNCMKCLAESSNRLKVESFIRFTWNKSRALYKVHIR